MHDVRLSRSPEWTKQFRKCGKQLQLQWRIDPCGRRVDVASWICETRQLLNRTRAAIRHEQHRMRHTGTPTHSAASDEGSRPHFSPAALVHRMLKSDALPSHIHAVVDEAGTLTTNADELKETMASHFEAVFALPADPPAMPAGGPPPPRMLFVKDGIDPQWYAGLMKDVDDEDILTALENAPLVSAPGEDEVSTGVWKIALHESAEV